MGRDSFKDLFSRQSADYAKYRPKYPEALFRFLAALCERRDAAWDCGTGSGQAALALARHFDRVFATDPSAEQLSKAKADPRVEYRQTSAEESGLASGSVDLVTAAQALHWFQREEFHAEVGRVCRPRGVIAAWCYGLAEITPEVDAVVRHLYEGILGSYWEKERGLVEAGYRGIAFPFEEIEAPRFEMTAEWSLEELVGYLGTWSALQAYLNKQGSNPLEGLNSQLRAAWGGESRRPVRWELALRVGRMRISI